MHRFIDSYYQGYMYHDLNYSQLYSVVLMRGYRNKQSRGIHKGGHPSTYIGCSPLGTPLCNQTRGLPHGEKPEILEDYREKYQDFW